MKLSIILPIFNEASTAGELLRRVWGAPLPHGVDREMVIVESHSTDGTREIVRRFAEEKSVESPGAVQLVLQDCPRGKGNAVKEGFTKATGDIILIQDGDSEYDVADYPALIEPILEGHAKFVLEAATFRPEAGRFENSRATRLNPSY